MARGYGAAGSPLASGAIDCRYKNAASTSVSVMLRIASDTLFIGSCGRTDLPGADYETLLKAITGVLFAFSDESVVYSGHGPETTIGRERRTNPFVLEYLAAR